MRLRGGGRTAYLALALANVACGSSATVDRSVGLRGSTAHGVAVADVPIGGHLVRGEGAAGTNFEGELIAVDDDGSIWIREWGSTDRPAHLVQVAKVEVRRYDSYSEAYGGWGALGALSTLSHGHFLVFTLPLWLFVSIPTSVGAADGAWFKGGTTVQLAQFAKYPQGLPPTMRSPPESTSRTSPASSEPPHVNAVIPPPVAPPAVSASASASASDAAPPAASAAAPPAQ